MMRELRSVSTEENLGAVIVAADGAVTFDRAAADVLGAMRRKLGDEAAARTVMAEGWSNGYLYLSEPTG